MKHKNLIKIIAFLLFFCLLDGNVMAETYGYEGIADNTSLENSNDYGYCDNCKYTTPDWDAGATTVQITTADGTTVTKTICSSMSATRVASKCDIVSDSYPNPLNDDGTTNLNYSSFWNEWLNEAIKDGELDTNSESGKMIAESFCTNGETTSECSEKIKDMVANSADDNMDFNVFPGQTVCDNNGECKIVNELNTDMCNSNTPGMNKVLCENVANACLSGSATSYQKNQNGKLYAKGSSGICTYDSEAKFDLDCEQQCAYNCGQATAQYTAACTKDCIEKHCTTLEEDDPNPDPTPEPSDPKECKQYTCEELYGTSGCTSRTQTLPETVETPASCGVNYYKKSYKLGGKVDSCGTTNYIIETTVTITVPSRLNMSVKTSNSAQTENSTLKSAISIVSGSSNSNVFDSTVYAGKGFNWGGFNGSATVITRVGDSSNLIVEKNKINTEIKNVELKIACKKEEIEKKYSEAKKSCSESMGTCMTSCMSDGCEGSEECIEKSKKCSQSCSAEVSNCQKNAKKSYDDAIEKVNEEEEKLKQPYMDALEQLNACQAEIASTSTKTETYDDSYFTESVATMTLGSYSQISGSVKSIDKNSGLMNLESITNNSFVNKHDFFIPYYTPNNTRGTLKQSVSSDFGSASVSCPFSVLNSFIKTSGNINLIYRPISLVNPFPNSSSDDSRKTIGYWSEGVSNMIILNNREVSNYEVYNLVPMYTITLTPSDIKEIRAYNKQNSYSDFNLECVDGLYCRSNFLWQDFNHLINNDKSCAMDSDWYACDSEYYAGARDELLKKLK